MALAGILAIVHPAMSSIALVIFFGWLLILSGIAQGVPERVPLDLIAHRLAHHSGCGFN
jgi:Short repeat of unknown function (DUF308)